MYAETENMMTSSQRIYQYTNLQEEDKLVQEIDKQLENWPETGNIEF